MPHGGTLIYRAPVLPNDRRTHRFPRESVPHHGRLALISDRKGGDAAWIWAAIDERLCDFKLRSPNIPTIMFDPPWLGEVLCVLALRRVDQRTVCIKKYRPRARRALVQRKDIFHVR